MSNASPDELVAVVSAALADSGPQDRQLLVSTVNIARAIFGAPASSVFLRSPDGESLTFEVVSGIGGEELVGTRFAADRGIVGWVAATGEPIIVQDPHANPHFAADIARMSGYIPTVIMAVPVSYADEVLGVIEVLDPQRTHPGIEDLDLLMMLAAHAGLALRGLARHRAARAALTDHGAKYADLAQMVGTFEQLDGPRREAGLTLLGAVQRLLV
jgi:GAF domain-containing protein